MSSTRGKFKKYLFHCFRQIYCPSSASHHKISDGRFYKFCSIYQNVNCQHIKLCIMRQKQCKRNSDGPYKSAIKQERNSGSSAGTNGKVTCIGKRIERREHTRSHNQMSRQKANLIRCIIDTREKERGQKKKCPRSHAHKYRECT